MDGVTDLSLKIPGRSIKSIPLFDQISFMVDLKIDKWTESILSILSITTSQECSLVQLMTFI